MQRKVAIKVLPVSHFNDFVERFKREVDLAARLI